MNHLHQTLPNRVDPASLVSNSEVLDQKPSWVDIFIVQYSSYCIPDRALNDDSNSLSEWSFRDDIKNLTEWSFRDDLIQMRDNLKYIVICSCIKLT